jgi:hypothetical protein
LRIASAVLVTPGLPTVTRAQQVKGSGADLGGLEGADAHCLALASAAGSTGTISRAYLSATAQGGEAGVNA